MPFRTPVFKTGAIAILPTLRNANELFIKSGAMLARGWLDFKVAAHPLRRCQAASKRGIVPGKSPQVLPLREKSTYVT
jgi:hypothetical protein